MGGVVGSMRSKVWDGCLSSLRECWCAKEMGQRWQLQDRGEEAAEMLATAVEGESQQLLQRAGGRGSRHKAKDALGRRGSRVDESSAHRHFQPLHRLPTVQWPVLDVHRYIMTCQVRKNNIPN